MAFLVILGLIALFLSVKGIHILREEKFDFISGSKWEVKTEDSGTIAELAFGMGAMLVQTLLSLLAMLSALYLTFCAKGLVKSALISYSFKFPRPSLAHHELHGPGAY
jgi:phosphate transport system permease protein